MSGVPGREAKFTLNLNPEAKRAFRTRTSGAVSLLLICDMHLCRCSAVILSAMNQISGQAKVYGTDAAAMIILFFIGFQLFRCKYTANMQFYKIFNRFLIKIH